MSRRLSRRTTIATALLIIALLVSGGAALQFATHRAPHKPLITTTCTGEACTGHDPNATKCFEDAQTVATLSIPLNGNAYLLYSPTCDAYWGLGTGHGGSLAAALTLSIGLQDEATTYQARPPLQQSTTVQFNTPLFGEASPTPAQLCGMTSAAPVCTPFTSPSSSPVFAVTPCFGQACNGADPGAAGCVSDEQPLPSASGQFNVTLYYSARCYTYWSVGQTTSALNMTLSAQGFGGAGGLAIESLSALGGSSPMIGGVPAATACGQGDGLAQFCTGYASQSSWPAYGYDASASNFNAAETTLTPSSAPQLTRKWPESIGATGRSMSDQPIVGNNLIYWGTWDQVNPSTMGGTIRAADLNGNQVWSTKVGQNSLCAGSYVVAGVGSTPALAQINGAPGLVVGGADGGVWGLNALTGAVIWSTGALESNGFVWSSPAIYNGSVYIGLASDDCDNPLVQGRLYKLDLNTGVAQKVFNVVPNGCTGGGVWGTPSLDTAAGLVYFGTGNNGNCTAGTGNYTEEIVALNMSDLSVHAFVRELATDLQHDYDFGSAATLLFTAPNGTKLVGFNSKDGYYYALNRDTLSLVWKVHISDAGEDAADGRGSIAPAAYDGTTLYIAGGRSGTTGSTCSSSYWGFLAAVNPGNGGRIWTRCFNSPILGSVTACPGLIAVAYGYVPNGPDPSPPPAGKFFVIRASDGANLYQYTESGTNGQFFGPATFADARIYIGNTDGNLLAFGL